MRSFAFRVSGLPSLLLLAACGGTAVVEQGAGGAGGGAGSSVATSSVSTSASSTGAGSGPCTSHEQCPGGVCVFSTGVCAKACGSDFCETCGVGYTCEQCATASCPDCLDCLGACVPTPAGRCDDDDPCPPGSVCKYATSYYYCLPICGPDISCPDSSYCDRCAASSCCACKNCVPACVGGK